MVGTVRVLRKSNRSKASSSLAVRKSTRSTGVTASPPDSPSGAVNQASEASRGRISLESTDPSLSPFFMHHADHPGLNIISHRLEETNYGDWSVAMRTSLDAKNKLGFVDGIFTRPLESDVNFRLWFRCNSMVKSWLLNSVSPQIYRSILRMNDASEIWRDLFSRFNMTNLPRTYNLTQEIQDLRQGTLSLSAYYTRLKTLWDQLDSAEELDEPCVCGKAARTQQKAERAKIVKLLAGLNESYAIIRRQIIAQKVLPTLPEVYNILDQDNSQEGFSDVIAHYAAFQVSELHSSPATPPAVMYVQNGLNKGRPICSFCNRVGHIADKCYKKHGFPPGFTPKSKFLDKVQKQQPVTAQVSLSPPGPDKISGQLEMVIGSLSSDQLQNVIAMISTQLQNQSFSNQSVSSSGSMEASTSHAPTCYTDITFSPSTYYFVGILAVSQHTLSDTWVIDSGATHHVSFDRNLFLSLDTSVESYVNLPTGPLVKISGVGMIQLNKDILLKNVLFIPEFCLSLISISSLTSDLGSRVIFDPTYCEI